MIWRITHSRLCSQIWAKPGKLVISIRKFGRRTNGPTDSRLSIIALFVVLSLPRTIVVKNTENAFPLSDSKRLCVETESTPPSSSSAPQSSSPSLPPPSTSPESESAVEVLKRSFALERVFLLTVDTTDDHSSIVPPQWRERPNTCFLLEVGHFLSASALSLDGHSSIVPQKRETVEPKR